MLSKATFDLDANNGPIVKLEICTDSKDVRDKIAKRFIEGLGHSSIWCEILLSGKNEYLIFPLSPTELRKQAEDMIRVADELDAHKKSLPPLPGEPKQ